MNDPKLINPDNRESDLGSIKNDGFKVQQLVYQYLNDIIFKTSTDHIWGTSAQTTNNEATFYTDAAGATFDKNSDPVTIEDDDKVLIAHNATLADDLNLSTTAERLKIEMLKGNTLDLGDSGGGVPYLFQLDIDNARLCDIYTTEDFQDLTTLTDEQQRVVKNRGQGNIIRLNNRQIFSGNFPIEIQSSVLINDPYVISQNGDSYEGFKVSGSNDDACLFTDWWKAWNGVDLVGDGSILIPPVFNPADGILQRKVFTDDPAGRFLRLNTPFGGSSGVDPDVHSRTSSVADVTISTYTSSASAEISGITDADAIKLKIGARVADVGLSIPQDSAATTIISSIIHNSTNNNSIFLIDSETGGDAVVSATGNLTIDMSGNSGISHQLDAFQAFQVGGDEDATGPRDVFGIIANRDQVINGVATAGFSRNQWSTTDQGAIQMIKPMNDGTNDDPRTGGQTRPVSYQRQSYLIL